MNCFEEKFSANVHHIDKNHPANYRKPPDDFRPEVFEYAVWLTY